MGGLWGALLAREEQAVAGAAAARRSGVDIVSLMCRHLLDH